MLQAAKNSPQHPPTLIFTGATASVKSNAMMSSFSTGKYALRALSQSLGKEFGPQGIHVAHAVIDGVIDIERTKGWMKDAGPDAKISPHEVNSIQTFSTHDLWSHCNGSLLTRISDCQRLLAPSHTAKVLFQ